VELEDPDEPAPAEVLVVDALGALPEEPQPANERPATATTASRARGTEARLPMTGETVASAPMLSRPSRRWLITRGAPGGVLAALGAVVSACGGASQPVAKTTWTIGTASVPPRGVIALGARTLTPVWVSSPQPGRYVAVSGVCPHNDCPVELDPNSDQLGCPCHGSLFDAFTGRVLQGPATSDLARIPVVQRGDTLVVGPFSGPAASD